MEAHAFFIFIGGVRAAADVRKSCESQRFPMRNLRNFNIPSFPGYIFNNIHLFHFLDKQRGLS